MGGGGGGKKYTGFMGVGGGYQNICRKRGAIKMFWKIGGGGDVEGTLMSLIVGGA